MKILFSLIIALLLTPTMSNTESIYDFPLVSIDGEAFSLEEYRGKVILIVNVASKCGFTKQYEGLQSLYEKHSDDGLVIIGFPANNFAGQEPGSNEDIKQFCTRNFGVTFPLSSKVSVKGDDQAPVFEYLKSVENEDFTGDIKWNFEKFLIDRDGKLQRRFRSSVKPEGRKMRKALEALL